MIPSIYKWIDQCAINVAAARMATLNGLNPNLDAGERLLRSPDFFPSHPESAELKFASATQFEFATAYPSANVTNDLVHGHFYRCGDEWKTRPTILLIHGWNDLLNHWFYFPRHAQKLNRAGINAVTLQMPWHFARRPHDLGAAGNFLSADILRTAEAARQALADIRSMINWMIENGCPFVGLWGVSMGAWLAGLTACHDRRIGAVALTVPPARLDRLITEVKFCATIREALRERPIDMQKLSLTDQRPLLTKENILLIEAEFDQFVPKQAVEELWQAWDQPEIWRLRTGHIGILWNRGLAMRTVQWLVSRANAAVVK